MPEVKHEWTIFRVCEYPPSKNNMHIEMSLTRLSMQKKIVYFSNLLYIMNNCYCFYTCLLYGLRFWKAGLRYKTLIYIYLGDKRGIIIVKFIFCQSLTHSVNHWRNLSITDSLCQSLTHSVNHWRTLLIIDALCQSLTHSVNHWRTLSIIDILFLSLMNVAHKMKTAK